MTNEREAAADDDTQEEKPVLSDWLTGQLRGQAPVAPRSAEQEGVGQAAQSAAAADMTVGQAAQSAAAADMTVGQAAQSAAAANTTVALEPDPTLIFLERERRLRRAQRVKVAVIAVGLALLTGGYLLSRRATDSTASQAETASATKPATAPVAAKQFEPTPVQNLDLSEQSEPADVHEAVKAGLPATIGSLRTPADKTDPGAAIPGGPSIARYPDLPREVLIQLEKAANPPAP